MSVITPNTFVFDVAAVISPPLDVAREQFQDHSDIGRAGLGGGGGGGGGGGEILNQCFHRLLNAGLSFDVREWLLSFPFLHGLPFIFLSPLLSFHRSFLFSPLFPMLTAVVVSFSLSKNIVFLPWCKGGEISTHVLPFHLQGGGEGDLGGNQVS